MEVNLFSTLFYNLRLILIVDSRKGSVLNFSSFRRLNRPYLFYYHAKHFTSNSGWWLRCCLDVSKLKINLCCRNSTRLTNSINTLNWVMQISNSLFDWYLLISYDTIALYILYFETAKYRVVYFIQCNLVSAVFDLTKIFILSI